MASTGGGHHSIPRGSIPLSLPDTATDGLSKAKRPAEVATFLRRFEVPDRHEAINCLLLIGLRQFKSMAGGGVASLQALQSASARGRQQPPSVVMTDFARRNGEVPNTNGQATTTPRPAYVPPCAFFCSFQTTGARTSSAPPPKISRRADIQLPLTGHQHGGGMPDIRRFIAEKRRQVHRPPTAASPSRDQATASSNGALKATGGHHIHPKPSSTAALPVAAPTECNSPPSTATLHQSRVVDKSQAAPAMIIAAPCNTAVSSSALDFILGQPGSRTSTPATSSESEQLTETALPSLVGGKNTSTNCDSSTCAAPPIATLLESSTVEETPQTFQSRQPAASSRTADVLSLARQRSSVVVEQSDTGFPALAISRDFILALQRLIRETHGSRMSRVQLCAEPALRQFTSKILHDDFDPMYQSLLLNFHILSAVQRNA